MTEVNKIKKIVRNSLILYGVPFRDCDGTIVGDCDICPGGGGGDAAWGGISGTLSDQTDLQNALDDKEDTSNKGIAGGYASLDGAGLVPASQLPSYVDDVLEFADFAAFPGSGTTGKIYVAIDTGFVYRWSGSAYIQIAASAAVWGTITGTLSAQTDLQTALNLKANLASPTFTGTVSLPATTSIGTVTNTEINYLTNVSSDIQTQINSKQATITGAATTVVSSNLTASRALASDGSGKIAVSTVTSTELGYVSGVTSALQTQLNAKLDTASFVPAGSNTHVQFNNSGAFGGSANLTWNGSILAVTGAVTSSTTITAGASSTIGWTGRSLVSSPSDGLVLMTNAAGTAFTRLQLGGTTSSFPAIKRNATSVDLRLADDSAYADLSCGFVTSANSVTIAAGGEFRVSGRSRLSSAADGVFRLSNNGLTDFDRLQFGGTTSSFPALKRSAATLQVRLADDTGFANLSVGTVNGATLTSGTLNGSVTGTNTGDQTTIVGITGTKAQFNTAVTDGDFLYVGDISGNATHTGDATGATALTVVGINGTLLSGLGTGILKNTTGTGVPSIAVAGDFPTLNQNTTGSAATLTTPRTINGVSFNGSANITVTAAAGTLTGTALNATVVTSSLTSVGTIATGVWNGTLITPTYGGTNNAFTGFTGPTTSIKTFTLPNASAVILTDNAAVTVAQGGTGRATSTTAYGLLAAGTTATGAHQTLAAGATTDMLVGGGASALPVWTTATGTGAPVRATSPTLVTPDLGLATATRIIVAGQYVSTAFALTDASSIEVDWDNANVQYVTLGGNRTIDLVHHLEGGRYVLALTQDGGGSRTVTWTPTITWRGGTAPTLQTAGNTTDIITFLYVNGTYFGDVSQPYA